MRFRPDHQSYLPSPLAAISARFGVHAAVHDQAHAAEPEPQSRPLAADNCSDAHWEDSIDYFNPLLQPCVDKVTAELMILGATAFLILLVNEISKNSLSNGTYMVSMLQSHDVCPSMQACHMSN